MGLPIPLRRGGGGGGNFVRRVVRERRGHLLSTVITYVNVHTTSLCPWMSMLLWNKILYIECCSVTSIYQRCFCFILTCTFSQTIQCISPMFRCCMCVCHMLLKYYYYVAVLDRLFTHRGGAYEPTQSYILQGSVNENQLRSGKKRHNGSFRSRINTLMCR